MFDYTKTAKTVIFQIPLSDYLGKRRYFVYNQETKTRDQKEKWLESLQEYEELIFDDFDFPYIPFNELYDAENMKSQAAAYLKKEIKATPDELILFDDEIERAIASAASDAYRVSYLDEWMDGYRKQLAKQLANDFADIPGRLLDDPADENYMRDRSDCSFFRLEINKSDIKAWLKENYPSSDYHKQPDYIDYFHDNALDISIDEVNTKFIDYYGQLGDYYQWFDYFKDYQGSELISDIKDHRKKEQAKINSNQLMQENTAQAINAIIEYNDKYIKAKDKHEKIARQISALASTIKKA